MGSHTISPAQPKVTRRILDALRSIIQELRASAVWYERQYGLSAAQLFVLRVLDEEEELSLGQVAKRTMTHQSSASVVVRKLEGKKLVIKAASREDSRRLVLRLTAAGRRLLVRTPRPVQEALLRRLESLDHRQQSTLAELLEKVAPSLAGAPTMFFEEATAKRRKRKAR